MDYRDWAELNMNLMALAKRPAGALSIGFKQAQTVYLLRQALPVNVADLKPVEPAAVPSISNRL